MHLAELPYRRNSADLFRVFAAEPWSVFLDSGHPFIDSGRFDFMSARPYMTLTTRGNETTITAGKTTSRSDRDPFELLRESIGPPAENYSGIPFCGGAMGYFAYDLGRRIERLPSLAADEMGVSDMAVQDWNGSFPVGQG